MNISLEKKKKRKYPPPLTCLVLKLGFSPCSPITNDINYCAFGTSACKSQVKVSAPAGRGKNT
ncbi:MAG: hypothetical protein K0S39_817 [Paenibacillus sp.]|jgi:hypothetical protein|nr:hypothetical protein [Paenibacillus sp.]